ncbi:MAG: hypothetical protein FWF63_02980 [Fibromonadales bacterium]|nr:hypothetical protein [Fibromonadales bacterium]
MKSKLREIVLIASVLLALSFTLSCAPADDDNNSGRKKSSSSKNNGSSSSKNNSSSSDGKSSSSATKENSQIYVYGCDYDYEPDEDEEYEPCSFKPYTGSGKIYEERFKLEVGTVNNGIINLPQHSEEDPDEEYLDSVFYYADEEQLSEYCSEYSAIDGVYMSSFYLEDNDYVIYDLSSNSDDENEKVMYWYFSKAGKLICELDEVKYKLTVKEGWNKIYYKITYTEEYTSTEEYSTSDILTQEVKWFGR